MDEIWTKSLEVIRNRMPNKQHFEAWIKPLRLIGPVRDGEAVFQVPSRFFGEWVEEKYKELIESVISEQADRPLSMTFHVVSEPLVSSPKSKTAALETDQTSETMQRRPSPSQTAPVLHVPDPDYTFDNFVVGDCNQFVYAAAKHVSDALAGSYNPLFIYGGTGVGKTHIMQAIGNAVQEKNPKVKVLYIASEKFMMQLISAIRHNRMFQFKEEFRSVDLLLMDDIQFIAGKKQTQEEFFHTFNTLFEANKQIVFTSDKFPNEIEHLEDRLRSRFVSGLIADMQPPDLETRIAILKKKAALEGCCIPEDVVFFLATVARTNVRELEGALIRVSAYASLTGQPLSISLAKHCLRDILKETERTISVEEIQKTVASYYKIRVADMRSKSRSRIVSFPRQIAMYLCKQITKHSLPEIGHQFGGRDHSTILYAVRKIEAEKKSRVTLAEEIETLTSLIQK